MADGSVSLSGILLSPTDLYSQRVWFPRGHPAWGPLGVYKRLALWAVNFLSDPPRQPKIRTVRK